MTKKERIEITVAYIEEAIVIAKTTSPEALNFLCKELKRKKKEQEALIVESTKIIKELPSRTKNALFYKGVKTDFDLEEFLDGKYDEKISFLIEKSPEGRLMSLRNVGKKNVEETMKILKKHGFIE